MLTLIITIIKLLIALTVVASIHEFGHFLFAKLFKTQVNEFSIGFGPKIVQKKFRDTMYSIRWLPLGGYVAIEGEDQESESANSFNKKNTLQKVIILCAGVLFNAILAIVIFVSVSSIYPTYDTTISAFSNNSVLQQAGLKIGDKVVSINGKKTNIVNDLIDQDYTNKDVTSLEYVRDGKKYDVNVNNAVTTIGYIGVIFKQSGNSYSNVVDIVDSGKAATKSGIKAGDKIVKINGIATNESSDIVNIVRKNPDKELNFTIDRNGETLEKVITPTAKKEFDLGIDSTNEVKGSIKYSWYKAYSNVETIAGSYVDLFKGKVKVTDMSGIVGIGEVVSKTTGVIEYLNLIGILSLAIGIANIMPFPPLDGGKVVIVVCEAILRKKLPIKAEVIISYIGFGLLILLSIYVTYNDILRVF